jgi:hypothetical protein
LVRHTLNAGLLSPWDKMLLVIKERCFAKRVIKHLLASYSAVNAENPDLSDKALYREVLLHTQQVGRSSVDQILRQAEDSIDEWTAPAGTSQVFERSPISSSCCNIGRPVIRGLLFLLDVSLTRWLLQICKAGCITGDNIINPATMYIVFRAPG